MKYSNKNYLQNPSDADVENILKVASERLQNGNVSGEAKVELLEETGKAPENSPVKTKPNSTSTNTNSTTTNSNTSTTTK